MLGTMLELALGSIHWCDTVWEAVWSHVGPRKCSCKIKEESRSLQIGQFSPHHALWFVVILLFLGSAKTHDSSEKINTQKNFFAVRLEMPGTCSVRKLIVSCPFCPCFLPFCPGPVCSSLDLCFSLPFSFSSCCHHCHLLRWRWPSLKPSPSTCSFEHFIWKPTKTKQRSTMMCIANGYPMQDMN